MRCATKTKKKRTDSEQEDHLRRKQASFSTFAFVSCGKFFQRLFPKGKIGEVAVTSKPSDKSGCCI